MVVPPGIIFFEFVQFDHCLKLSNLRTDTGAVTNFLLEKRAKSQDQVLKIGGQFQFPCLGKNYLID
jgi:hypothetical protein